MKKKINLRLVGITILSVLVTMVSMTFVYYQIFQRQVRKDLQMEAKTIQCSGVFEKDSLKGLSMDVEGLRISWIYTDGTVLYDNDSDIKTMENHLNRPEVQDAVKNGAGESKRMSDTMDINTFYYALKLEDGTILRVATEAKSMLSVFLSELPMFGLILALVVVISVWVSQLLTKQLLSPIESLARKMEKDSKNEIWKETTEIADKEMEENIYPEMIPFLRTFRNQHENILAAAKSRQDFTANVSHELKTPLTAISGYAELIGNHMVDGEQEIKFASEIQKNANRLLSLINDIIELSELDHTEAGVDFEEFDLYELVKIEEENLKISAKRRNVQLSVEGHPCSIRANRHMIQELIDNLCQNAIRYNKDGGMVKISVSEEAGRPVFVVSDNGIGIPKDQQSRVFERFYRVDKSRSKETGGTGLGLAIVKHIVGLHQAEIYLDSAEGVGTTIRVVF